MIKDIPWILFQDKALGFVNQLYDELNHSALDVSAMIPDHICYRVATLERYYEICSMIEAHGEVLVESEVNGRFIKVFKVHDFISYKGNTIKVVEIPSPKEGSYYQEGFEHVEFVLKENLVDFQKRYSKIVFDTKGLNKKLNPDLRIRMKGMSAKFHNKSLEEVIRIEQNR